MLSLLPLLEKWESTIHNFDKSLYLMNELGDSHTFIDSKAPYYNSHCLNKDIPGLIKQTNKAHLMESMLNINKQKRIDTEY